MFEDILRLDLHHMTAEGARHERGIHVHIVHAFEDMAHEPDPGILQIVKHMGDPAPRADLFVGLLVSFPEPDDEGRGLLPHPDRDRAEFRDRAEIIVAELHEGCAARVLHSLEGLKDHEDDRYVQGLDQRREGGRRRVGHHIDEEQVEIGLPDLLQRAIRCLRIIDQSEVPDFHGAAFQLELEGFRLLDHHFAQSLELFPICMVSHAQHTDAGVERSSSFNDHCHSYSTVILILSPCRKKRQMKFVHSTCD